MQRAAGLIITTRLSPIRRLAFGAPRFQSGTLTTVMISAVELDPGLMPRSAARCIFPHCVLVGRTSTLELSSDLARLRARVPASPAFASMPCHLAVTSAAYVCGPRPTVTRRPWRGFAAMPPTPVLHDQEHPHRCGVRFAVAHPRRESGSKKAFQPPAPIAAAPARLGARGDGTASARVAPGRVWHASTGWQPVDAMWHWRVPPRGARDVHML